MNILGNFFVARVRVFVTTGLIALVAVTGVPVLAQEAESEEQSILVESTIAEGIDPSTATTVDNLDIPVDQLELLVKPLTVEELQVEAAAWLILLRDKVQEIVAAEIAIKRENLAIDEKQEASKAVEDAKTQLLEAEQALENASSGTPEYEQATEQVEKAKETLREAEQAIVSVVETIEESQEDETIQEVIQAAEEDEEIKAAEQVLEDAQAERNTLSAGSDAYVALTEKIDTLADALLQLETQAEQLKTEVPGSDSYQELSQKNDEARAAVNQAVEAITNPEGAADTDASGADNDASPNSLEEEGEALEDVAADLEAIDDQTSSADAADQSVEQLEQVSEQLDAIAESQTDLKAQLLENVTRLQLDQGAIAERLNVVLDALEKKGGDVAAYQTYVDAVTGVELDLTDTQGLGIRLVSWLKAPDGGVQVGIGLLKFGGILIAAMIISPRLGRIVDRLLSRVDNVSTLFREFVVMTTKRGVLVVGALLALASLGVSLGPILALVGGASFVLAFALQSNLGNFASGLLLLVTKPFDVGDEVKVAGYWAYVESISLANTKLKAFDGSMISLPNNTVWGGDIINFTHADIRKQMFYIYVNFNQDMDIIYKMWVELAKSHPSVLDDPAPGWFPWNGHYESYICIGLSAWTETDTYWGAYVDLLKMLQNRLDELGIELTAPVQTVKLDQSGNGTLQRQLPSGSESA
ncbi:MAG: mechanosensitive ion channel domain-containing protein [Cyanobacteria bacterium P01_F01_bin.150]